MKKLMVILAGAALLLAACTPQELSNQALKDRLDQHDKDIAALQGDVNELKTAVSQINSNIAALQTVVTKLEANVYVKEVTSIKDGEGSVIGYTIKFTDNTSIAIYHGEKGEQGKQGEIGPQGPQGDTPVIGAQLYEGDYYWTVNGEFLKDEKGGLIPLTGEKGDKGKDGNDGKTPQVRINEGNWEVSYDGETWTVVGPAQTAAESVDVVFKGVKETKDQVIFTLADDSKLVIDKFVEFSLNMDESVVIDVVEGATTNVSYTLSGVGKGDSRVDAVAGGDWWAEVEATDKESGVLKVTAGANKKAKVLVYAVDGKGRSDMRALVFNGGTLDVTAPVSPAPAAGGEMLVPVVTNVDYVVEVEEDALSWISYAVTKAGETHKETLTLTIEKNNTPEDRSGKVELKDASGAVIQTIVVDQDPGEYTAPVFEDETGFKKYIMTTKGYDTDKDGVLSASEAKFIVDIDIPKSSYYGFSSFAGIEAFYNLKTFKYASYSNKATSIDLSSNSKLEVVELTNAYGSETKLTSLNLSNLRALKSVQVGLKGSLASIELGNVPQLKTLIAYNTALASIDVSGAPALESLTVYGTKLTKLDVSKNTKLQTLNAGCATLTEVTLPGAENSLKELSLNNAIAPLEGLSALAGLTRLDYDTVPMEEVDLSNCAKLTTLNLGATSNKALKKVDIRKAVKLANPTILSSVLKEVVIPEGADPSKWSNVTKQIYDEYYEMYKPVTFTPVPVEGGEEISDYTAGLKEPFIKKIILNKFDKNEDGAIDATEAKDVKELDLTECGLVDGDLAGLEVFPIEKLVLSGNKFTTFDASLFESLKTLVIDNNKLTSITLSDVLETLNASHNAFKTNPLPSSVKLKVIDLSYNQITSINSLQGSAEEINVSNNALTYLSLYGSYYLKKLDFSNNKLTSYGAHNNTALVWVNAANNQLSGWSFQAKQETLDFTNNRFKQIDISSVVNNNALKTINLTGNNDFNLVIVGAGNSMPEGLEIIGVENYNVLNAKNPTSQYQYNTKGNIKTAVADEKAEFGDITLNFSLKTKGFSIKDGGKAHITVKAGKERLIVSAVASDGTPTITISRSSGKVILTKETDQSYAGYGSYIASGHNPWTPILDESAKTSWTSFIVNGDENKVYYHLTPYNSSSDKTVEDEEIIFSVAGGDVVIYGLEIEGLRWDTANM